MVALFVLKFIASLKVYKVLQKMSQNRFQATNLAISYNSQTFFPNTIFCFIIFIINNWMYFRKTKRTVHNVHNVLFKKMFIMGDTMELGFSNNKMFKRFYCLSTENNKIVTMTNALIWQKRESTRQQIKSSSTKITAKTHQFKISNFAIDHFNICNWVKRLLFILFQMDLNLFVFNKL